MLLRIVGPFVLVVVASMGVKQHYHPPTERKRGSMEGKLIAGNLQHQVFTRHYRANMAQAAGVPYRCVNTTVHAEPSGSFRLTNWAADWQQPKFCHEGEFVRSATMYDQWSYHDDEGLAFIKFHCGKAGGGCTFVSSGCANLLAGRGGNYYADYQVCSPLWDPLQGKSFITGIQVYFTRNRGIVKMQTICEKPMGSGHEEVHGPEPQERASNWQAGKKQMCPPGTAVCGLNTKVDYQYDLQDDTGINEVMIYCCNYPS